MAAATRRAFARLFLARAIRLALALARAVRALARALRRDLDSLRERDFETRRRLRLVARRFLEDRVKRSNSVKFETWVILDEAAIAACGMANVIARITANARIKCFKICPDPAFKYIR